MFKSLLSNNFLAGNKYINYWVLHLLVVLSSGVPLMAINIQLPSYEIVLMRTLFAAAILFILNKVNKNKLNILPRHILTFLFSGSLTALFWILLVYCAKMSNASITLVGLATAPLWVSLIVPFLNKEQISFNSILVGLNCLFGIFMIFNAGVSYQLGLVIAIACGALGAIVTIVNARLAKLHKNEVMAFYQMLGAAMGTVIFASCSGNFNLLLKVPIWHDVLFIMLLALIFSVVSYLLLLKILENISAFNVTLANNLSPIYGTIIALLFSGHSEAMNIYFYAGSLIIVFSVFAYPLVKWLLTDTITD